MSGRPHLTGHVWRTEPVGILRPDRLVMRAEYRGCLRFDHPLATAASAQLFDSLSPGEGE